MWRSPKRGWGTAARFSEGRNERSGVKGSRVKKPGPWQRGGEISPARGALKRGQVRAKATSSSPPLEFHQVTPDRWEDLEVLFGPRGACAGCWCMWWRLPRSQFNKQVGEQNRRALQQIVESGEVPGILAYSGGEPAGWCCVAPREAFPALERSRILKRVDDKPIWSVVCFFVAKRHRRQGITVRLLQAAVEFARENGASIVEGYPSEAEKDVPAAFVYTGLASAFRQAGFKEVLRRSPKRPIMRYTIQEGQ